jgi:glycerol kinase
MEHKPRKQFNAVVAGESNSRALALVLDQGGSSTRGIVFDTRGRSLAKVQVPVAERRSGALRVEQDPLELLASLRECAQAVLAELGSRAGDCTVAGLCTQRASALAWNRRTGLPLSPVLSWQDRRAQAAVEALLPQAGRIEQLSGLRLSPHYGASKLRWLVEEQSEVRAAAQAQELCLGPLAGYLATRLCGPGVERVDAVSASRTQLLDLDSRQWSSELCQLFGIDPFWLPELVDPQREFGWLRVGTRRMPLGVVTGDQSAAVFSGGEPEADTVLVNLGTGAFVQRCLRAPLRAQGLLSSLLPDDSLGPRYALEGTINGAGSALSWCAERHGSAFTPELLEQGLAAAQEPPLFFNAHAGLAAPFWRSDLEARFSESARLELELAAVAESVLFLVCEIVQRMQLVAGKPARVAVSGGLSRSATLCQLLADLLKLEVERSEDHEATARGLAWLCLGGRFEPLAGERFLPRDNPALEARAVRWRSWLMEILSSPR